MYRSTNGTGVSGAMTPPGPAPTMIASSAVTTLIVHNIDQSCGESLDLGQIRVTRCEGRRYECFQKTQDQCVLTIPRGQFCFPLSRHSNLPLPVNHTGISMAGVFPDHQWNRYTPARPLPASGACCRCPGPVHRSSDVRVSIPHFLRVSVPA